MNIIIWEYREYETILHEFVSLMPVGFGGMPQILNS